MTPEQHAASAFHAAPDRVACAVCETCKRDGVWCLGGECYPCWEKGVRKMARELLELIAILLACAGAWEQMVAGCRRRT